MSGSSINPIIPGFAPDPSVTLIDDTFFLVTSTFHLFPGLPIYASKDLTSWRHIGNAINRQNQLSLAASSTRLSKRDANGEAHLATGGLYAPTIRHHKGMTYVVCTNVVYRENPKDDETQNFIVSTRDIWSGEWSDPVYFDFRGIDPGIFFDDDGRSYLQASASPGPMTKIHLFEIDLLTGKKLSEEKKIWDGTGGIYPEGPHIFKKDGWYYLLISEGGTYEDHMIVIARSKSIWGPYDSCDQNPILTARGTNEYVQHTGHSDMFQDQKGEWWAVCLAVRKKDERYVMGRETFLTAAKWPQGEWPVLNTVKVNPTLPDGKELVRTEESALTAEPLVDFLYIRDAKLGDYQFSNDAKAVTITASSSDLSQWVEPVTFVGKRQRQLHGTASVTMHTSPGAPDGASLNAGLACYHDEHRYARVYYDFVASEMVFEVVNNAKSVSRVSRHAFRTQDGVVLRMEYTEMSYNFSFRHGKGSSEWESAGHFDTLDITGHSFVGPIIGIFAKSEQRDVRVQFDDLEIN